MVEQTEQIVREAPDIEAYKIGLLQSAKALADRGIQIPPQMVAQMSGLQVKATELAQAGIGGYQPYLQEAGYTLGDAQTALGGAMAGALPFQTEAAGLMRTGAANVPGQLQAAQQGIQNALASGQMSTEQAQAALAQLGTGGQNIATQSVADQLAAYDAIPGVLGAASTGMGAAAVAGGDVAAAARQGGQNLMGALSPQLAASTQAARGMTGTAALEALGQAGGAQAGIDAATDAANQQALAAQQGLVGAAQQGQGAATAGSQAAALAAQQAGLGTTGAIQGARGVASGLAPELSGIGTLAGQQAAAAGHGARIAAQQAGLNTAAAIQGARGTVQGAGQTLGQAGLGAIQAAQAAAPGTQAAIDAARAQAATGAGALGAAGTAAETLAATRGAGALYTAAGVAPGFQQAGLTAAQQAAQAGLGTQSAIEAARAQAGLGAQALGAAGLGGAEAAGAAGLGARLGAAQTAAILTQGHRPRGPRRSKLPQAALAHMSRLLAALVILWARRAECRRRRVQAVRRPRSKRRRTKRRQFRAHGELRLKRRKPFSRPGPSARGRRNRALQA